MKSILLFPIVVLFACTSSPQKSSTELPELDSIPARYTTTHDSLPKLTEEQEMALDALNTLQVSTDERNRLYSTFQWAALPCHTPDTIIMISQVELLHAMNTFVNMNCSRLPLEQRQELASQSVRAEENYHIAICLEDPNNTTFTNGVPLSGTWVLRNVLHRRDVVMVW
ncbi:MAG: hypothetical protein EP346_12280 [Bacteroidetes bacterium]|nr:MAG: hypothetical protein EP346_12280 [Bacteroidota bacterium]